MTSPTALEETYTANATTYDRFLHTPLGTLESQLFHHTFHTLHDLTDLRILDLGGGTGLRARAALAAGAASVDLVDISASMMRIGQQACKPSSRIRWFQADVSQPLDHLPLGTYDAVIANGIFDHAGSEAELEAMWRNAARYLRAGGWVVANRNNPRSKVAREAEGVGAAQGGGAVGKYGVAFSDFRPFQGGYSYRYRMLTDPPLEFGSKALDCYAAGSLEVAGRFFEGFRTVPWEETEVVRANPAFWREYLEDPVLYIFTARKKGEGSA